MNTQPPAYSTPATDSEPLITEISSPGSFTMDEEVEFDFIEDTSVGDALVYNEHELVEAFVPEAIPVAVLQPTDGEAMPLSDSMPPRKFLEHAVQVVTEGDPSGIVRLTTAFEQITLRKDGLKEQNERLKQQNERLEDVLREITARFDALEETNAQQQEMITELRLVNAQQQVMITELRLVNAQQQAMITELRLTNAQQQETITELRLTNAQQQETITELRLTNAQQQETITELRLTNAQQQETITENRDLRDQMVALTQRCAILDGFVRMHLASAQRRG